MQLSTLLWGDTPWLFTDILAFEEAWEQAISGSLDGLPVRFPDLRSLLKNKRASGRAKDLADVEELEKVAKFVV